jgi:hypothetical protein
MQNFLHRHVRIVFLANQPIEIFKLPNFFQVTNSYNYPKTLQLVDWANMQYVAYGRDDEGPYS